MLGREASFCFVEFGEASGSHEVGLEQGGLPVFIEVGLRIGNSRGNIFAETRIVLLVTAAGGGDHDAVFCRKRVEEGRAGGESSDYGCGPLKRLQQFRDLTCGEVRSAQIEL